MEKCAICQKNSENLNQHEFYYGKTVDQYTTNWNSSAVYLTGVSKSYAICESPIKGYLCSSCVKFHTLKRHLLYTMVWLLAMTIPWLMLYLISKHVDTNQIAQIMFYVCASITLGLILFTTISVGLNPRRFYTKIIGPFSVLFSDAGVERYGDILLARLKAGQIPIDNEVVFSRKRYQDLTDPQEGKILNT